MEGNGGEVSFADLARIIGKGWKEIDGLEREKYERMANKESVRYRAALDAYKAKMRQQNLDAHDETMVVCRGRHGIQSSEGQPVTNTQPQIRSHFSFPLASRLQAPGPGSMLTATNYQQQRNPVDSFSVDATYQRYPVTFTWPQTSSVMFSGSVAASLATKNVLPIPNGAHVMLHDHMGTHRLHVVQYRYCWMNRRTAHEYMGILQPPVSKLVKATPSHSYGSWFDTSRNTCHSVDSFDSDELSVDRHALYPSRSTDSA